MPTLFLSYRRADSPDTVKLVYERLKARLPRWDIFYDHKSIPLGEVFPERLKREVTSADVVLVVVGPKWLQLLRERQSQPIDRVREEVRFALQAGHTVIPVGIVNAGIPSEGDLTDFPDLQPLSIRNGRPIRPEPDFDSDIERLAVFLDQQAPHEVVGTVLAGRYKVVREIGDGGMGVVYVAEQLQPKRTVAVKLIKPGMDSKEVLARFDAERQALAVMDHPNIAKVLDAGTAASGRPFFVMEYVKGSPITEFCDAKRLAPTERLALFQKVCHAVQHAHQKGIIHRDIKPSNVLVELVDGRPEPKVIDFGLAKALGFKLTDKTLVSETGRTVGTLLYSSPEQAAGRTHEIDTRTDIYSLGALLYELLAGAPPFTEDQLQKIGDDAMKRAIIETEPSKPSKNLSSSNSLPSIAANRQFDPARLTRLVRGDLDWIVMKSLEKEPNRRYATATSLADDIGHYLHDEPISAGKPSTLYRVRKFARRNRVTVLAGSAIFIVLVAGIIGTSLGYVAAKAAERRAQDEAAAKETARAAAEEQRKRAEAATATAQQRFQLALDAFNQMVFGIQNKLENHPGTQDLRKDILENARNGLKKLLKETEKQGNPDQTLVWTYFRMGDVEQVLGHTLAAQEEYQTGHDLALKLAEADPSNARAQRDLSVSYNKLGDMTLRLGQTKAALNFYEKSLAVRRRLAEADPKNAQAQRDLSISYTNLGDATLRLGQTKASLDFYEKSLAVCRRLAEADPKNAQAQRDLSISYTNLGNVTLRLGQTQAALDFYEKSLAVDQRLAEADPKNAEAQRGLSVSYNKLGNVTLQLGQTKAALDFYEKSLAVDQRLAEADPKNAQAQRDLSISYCMLGNVTLRLGQTQAALDFYEKSLAADQRLAEADPKNAQAQRDLSVSYNKLGDMTLRLGQTKASLDFYEKSLAVDQRLAEADPKNAQAQRDLSVSYNKLGSVTLQLGQTKAALGFYEKSLAVRQRLAQADPKNAEAQRDLLVSYCNIGWVSDKASDFTSAIEWYRKAAGVAKHVEKPELFESDVDWINKRIATCEAALNKAERP